MRQRWAVGGGAMLRARLLRSVVAGSATVFTGVACTRLPDGTTVAVTGDLDGYLRMWDLATGERHPTSMEVQLGNPRAVRCAELADGRTVVVAAEENSAISVVDLLTGGRLWSGPSGHARAVLSLAGARLPDGTAIVVTSGSDGTIRCADLATGRPWPGPPPDGRRWPLAACTETGTGPVVVVADGEIIHVWDLPAGRFRDVSISTGFEVDALACVPSADGEPLVIAGSGRMRRDLTSTVARYGTVRAWDLVTGRPYGPPHTAHGGEITALAGTLLPDGTPLAISVDRYGTVRVLDLATGHPYGPALPSPGESPEVSCARLPDGTPVAVTAEEELRVWSLDVRPPPDGLTGPLRLLGRTPVPGGEEVVVTVGVEHRRGYAVQCWSADTGEPRRRPDGAGAAEACTRTRDGTPVVLAPDAGGVREWDLATGEPRDVPLPGLTGEPDILDCVGLPDGTSIVITGDGPPRAWDADTGSPYGRPLPVDAGWRRALAGLPLPNGELIAAHIDNSGAARAWSLLNGEPLGPPFTREADIVAATPLPDGIPMAVTASSGHWEGDAVRVWDLVRCRSVAGPLPVRAPWARALACSVLPDGTAVAAVGAGPSQGSGIVQVWDLATEEELDVIEVPDPVMGIALTAAGRLVAATELDVFAYDLDRTR